MRWSEDETYKFVVLYQSHQCLWNTSKLAYRNRSQRRAAYTQISRMMNMDGFGINEVKQKIKNLRSTYNQELHKISECTKSGASKGEVYIPSLVWFRTMHQIMTHNNSESQEKPEVDDLDMTEDEQPVQETVEIQPRSPIQLKSNKKRHVIKGTKQFLNNILNSINEQKTVVQIVTPPEPCADENKAFGRYVGLALKQLTPRDAILAKSDIMNVLMRYRLNATASSSSPGPSNEMPLISNVVSETWPVNPNIKQEIP